MYIVNAPMLFSGIWAMIKPWLDEKTRQKIHIKGSSYQKELLEQVRLVQKFEFIFIYVRSMPKISLIF